MMMFILILLKGLILLLYVRFILNVLKNRKQDATLKFSVDFISVIEIATVSALSLICVSSSLSIGSTFISMIAFINIIVLYFEGKRVILIGEKAIQIRGELVPIAKIQKVETSLWTLHVHTKDKELKVMNPLVVSWKFQENVYKKLKCKGSQA